MKVIKAARAVRNVWKRVEINANYHRGKELIPRGRELLHIETSSVCNLECKFCAYVKKQSPKVSMTDEFFFDCVEQAVELGYHSFSLTPCTGDVFMDKRLFNKLEFLENHPGVESYQFFTNFTIPTADEIERLVGLEKLGRMTVSVYGHDLESFIAITCSTEKVYGRLVANLETLLELVPRARCQLELGFRSTQDALDGAKSEVLDLFDRYREAGIRVRRSRIYNNWGGYVTQDDVAGLAIDIGSDTTYKKGACVLLFTSVSVMATGIVNGCACRDVDATLRIGDLNETPLRDILSTRNPLYMGLIQEQQEGHFRPVCTSCDFYKSIYHMRSAYRRSRPDLQSLSEFMESLDVPENARAACSATPE